MTRARNSANLASHGNLFVDIANDRTGIGSVAPAQNLHVAGTAGFHADVTFTGDLYNATWDRSENKLKFDEFSGIRLGNNNELQIDHRGTSYILNIDSNPLQIGSNTLQLMNGGTTQNYLYASVNNDLLLYRAGSERFRTKDYGVNVTGTTDTDGLVVSGVATVTTMNVTGVLTYDDVTSVDSVGIVTARQGVRVTADGSSSSNYISVGAGSDLKLWHDSNNVSRIQSDNQILYIKGADIRFYKGNSSELFARFISDGAVELYHNNAKKLETKSSGINVLGHVHATSTGSQIASGDTSTNDYLLFYHDGSNGFIQNGTGGLTIKDVSGGNIEIQATSGETSIFCGNNGSVQLYYDNAKKIETAGHGINITGGFVATGDCSIADKLTHAGDENTAIRFPSADTIQFETGGTTMVGITTRTAISSHTGNVEGRGQLSVRTNGTGDTIALSIGAHAAIPSTHASGSATTGVTTAIYVESSYAKRPEIRFHNSHNGNWHDSPGNTSHLRMVWTTPESSTTPEVVDIHPRVSGNAGGAFSGLRIRVTDNTNGLRNCLFLQHDAQYFYVNNSATLYNDSSGTGIAENLYHVGDTDTKLSFPAANTISATTGGTERLRITSGGLLLLGTTDTGFSGSFTTMTIGNASTQNTGLTIASSPSNGFSRLHFADANSGTATYAGFIAYSHASDAFLIGTNNSGTEKLRITSAGHIVPSADSTSDLGLTGTRWRNLYADTLYGDGSNLTGINTDLVSDTSPQLGGDLDTNSHHILLDDDHEVKFGANSDLRIFHANGNANFIQSYNDFDFRIHTFGTSAKLRLQVNESENSVVCTPNGPTELYYDNEMMFRTNQDGSEFFDSDNNCNVYFTCNGTRRGYIFVDSTNGGKMSFYDNQDHPMLSATKNGAVELYYDNSKKFETNSAGAKVTGVLHTTTNIRVSGEIDLGTSNGNKFMDVCLGDNYGFYLRSTSGEGLNHEALARFERNRGAILYWDANTRFETTTAGIDVTGTITMDAVPGTNTNAALPVLFQTSAGVIDGGSQLTYNPGGDVLVVNGLTLSSTQVRTSGNNALQLTTANANGTVDLIVRTTHVECNGHFLPQTNNTDDLGGSGKAWRNLYVNDAHFSNKGHSNDVDGTWGDWTLQEGENDVFMINNRTGKKFAITMREVS